MLRSVPIRPAPRSALAAALLLTSASAAHADVAPPPTLVADYLWLGLPLGPIAGLALLAAAVVLYRHLRRRGRGRLAAAVVGVAVFVAGNVVCYVLALSLRRRGAPDLPPPYAGQVPGAPARRDVR
jgi:hypothetical protein